jgi:hypothetical protein
MTCSLNFIVQRFKDGNTSSKMTAFRSFQISQAAIIKISIKKGIVEAFLVLKILWWISETSTHRI